MTRIEELEKQITEARKAYYLTGTAIMEDPEYDEAVEELERLDPTNELLPEVDAEEDPDSPLEKVPHKIPMGSQHKAMDKDELMAWVKNTLEKAGINSTTARFHASHKMDGCSVAIEYRTGKLFQVLTRGKGGIRGEDITHNAIYFQNLPKTLKHPDGTPASGFVRAELMLHTDDWEEVEPDMTSNPRNCGNGIARRLDSDQAEYLRVYAFRWFNNDVSIPSGTEEENAKLLEDFGFTVAPNHVGTIEEIWQWFETLTQNRAKLAYWIDGIVVKLNDIPTQLSLGVRDNRPKGQIAVKFPSVGTPSILEDIVVTVGHTGAIIPTGKFTPVSISGTTVDSALLCNWQLLQKRDIAVNDKVELYKAGEIIPRVLRVTERPANRRIVPEPTVCPVCAGIVGKKKNVGGKEGALLFCLNPDCSAKIFGKLKRYVKSLEIKGAGPAVLNALIKDFAVKDPADLYTLHQNKNLPSLLTNGKTRFGSKRAEELLKEIDNKRELTISDLLGSLGIDGLGKRRVTIVQELTQPAMDTLEDWLSGKLITVAAQAQLPNTATRIQTAIEERHTLIERLLAAGVSLKKTAYKEKIEGAPSFCITGKLTHPKEHYAALAPAAGFEYKTRVDKGLTYLVMADPNSTTTKADKAKKYGTKCISESELLALLTP